MLGPNKWRLLTIVAGILLAHAIDSPVRAPRSTLVQHQQPQQYQSASTNVRNLYRPYQTFSNVDTVRYVERQFPANERTARQAFGSFRYPDNSRRRSDIRLNHTTQIDETPPPARLRPVFIPLNQESTNTKSASSTSSVSLNTTLIEEIQSRTDANIFNDSSDRQQIKFPDSAAAAAALPLRSSDDITGRRSGIQFTAQSQKFKNIFQPQGYREDNPDSANYQFPYSEELSPPAYDESRFARGIVAFEQQPAAVRAAAASSVPITVQQQDKLQKNFDDVTKFGDVNGPVTATLQQRQYSEYIDRPYDGRATYDSGNYYSGAYDEYSRSPRYYTAPKAAYVEYSDYPGPPRSRLITPWKSARSPRVVFPQAGDVFPSGAASVAPISASGSSAATSYNSDNVVFR